MQAAAFLVKNKKPTRAQIAAHMAGHVCRCGCYNQIVAAVERAAKEV
jgi:aerobic-type carbon monoxide dehydrogenase small subunit (CoxS/CutS family)